MTSWVAQTHFSRRILESQLQNAFVVTCSLHGGFVTVDMIFARIRKGHLELTALVKDGIDWFSVPDEIRYHWIHRQIAHDNGLNTIVFGVIQNTDTPIMTSLIGRLS